MLIKSYVAAGAVAPYRVVSFTSNDGEVAQASAAAQPLCGVTGQLGADVAGDRIDVTKVGRAEVEFGDDVNAGDPLTVDAQGRAIAAAPASGVTVRVIGHAEQSAQQGDVADFLINLSQITGA